MGWSWICEGQNHIKGSDAGRLAGRAKAMLVNATLAASHPSPSSSQSCMMRPCVMLWCMPLEAGEACEGAGEGVVAWKG